MEATIVNTTERLSASRWMALTIILLVQFQIQLVTFAPAAVASPIISNLQLSRTEFGLIMSALNITIVICQVLGSVLVDRSGPKLGLFFGVALLGIGAAVLFGVHSLGFLIFGRVLQGIGIGICYPVMGALIMAWFSKREQPYINMIFALVTFSGIGAAMLVTAGLFRWFSGSWKHALGSYGFSILATALVWLVIGRNSKQVVSAETTSPAGATARNPSSLSKVLTMPVAWTLAVGAFAISWVYNMYFSFVPLFLESGRGFSLADANRLASLLPFSGVAGFGLSGFLPVLNTYIMSLPSMTPSLVAAFVVVVNVAIYMAGFISPLAVGWVSQSSFGFGLRNTLALFSWIDLVAILMFMRLPTIASMDVSHLEGTSPSFND